MTTSQESVMIVDDTQPNLRLLCSILENSGLQLRPFSNPKAALKSAKAQPPNLILLDINMPEMNGYQLCEQLHDNPNTQSLPVIFISAHKETEGIVKGFQHGAVDYITKPFQAEEVLSRIHTHLKLYRIERSLSQKNTALQAALRELKETQSQLVHAEKMAALGTLTAGMAHEINNPISFIQANTQIISKRLEQISDGKRSFDAEEISVWRDLMDGFKDGGSRIAEIVQSLETYARLDEETLKPFEAKENLEATIRLYRHKLKGQVDFKLEVIAPQACILANAGKINQVFGNLLCNAIDAVLDNPGKTRPSITVTAKPLQYEETEWYAIEVKDNGPGISEQTLKQIFDPFFTTKPIGKGLGLGLSIASKIMEQHNGRLTVKSTPQRTCFQMLLPHAPS